MFKALAGLLAGLALFATTTATTASAVAETTSDVPKLALPAPTGPLPVGASTLHLVDGSRTDPWVPSSGHRQLMVTMRYPTAVRHGHRAPYMTPAEAKAFLDFQRGNGVPIPADLPASVVTSTRTHATADAPPLPRVGGRPLVVLSPGFSLPRATLTGLAEDLASRGYVVAAVDHAYESSGTSFPGGLKTCVACDTAEPADVVAVRAADMSYVLDRLLGRHPAWRYGRMIDSRRIGMVGHSIGGASVSSTMAVDARVDAGVNLDGTFFGRLPAAGLAKPFLMLGTQQLHHAGGDDESWDGTWAQLHGPRHWFSVDGTGHLSFTDTAVLADQLGIADPTVTMSGRRSTQVTRAYVRTFLGRYLRGAEGSLLDGPSPRYPEVHPQP